MSAGDRRGKQIMPAEWRQLERMAEESGHLLERWIRRAREAEEEVESLRSALEELAAGRSPSEDIAAELKRLKAENAALHSRMLQARKRISGLMQRLATLDVAP